MRKQVYSGTPGNWNTVPDETRVSGTAVRHYTYDANGNVGQLVDEDGAIVAHYEYDPFGNEIRAEGDDAQANPFRFSTKYLDAETGLYYYGFRYYTNSGFYCDGLRLRQSVADSCGKQDAAACHSERT